MKILKKIVRGPENIIYLNINKMEGHHFDYDLIFVAKPKSARPKRQRIGAVKEGNRM